MGIRMYLPVGTLLCWVCCLDLFYTKSGLAHDPEFPLTQVKVVFLVLLEVSCEVKKDQNKNWKWHRFLVIVICAFYFLNDSE